MNCDEILIDYSTLTNDKIDQQIQLDIDWIKEKLDAIIFIILDYAIQMTLFLFSNTNFHMTYKM